MRILIVYHFIFFYYLTLTISLTPTHLLPTPTQEDVYELHIGSKNLELERILGIIPSKPLVLVSSGCQKKKKKIRDLVTYAAERSVEAESQIRMPTRLGSGEGPLSGLWMVAFLPVLEVTIFTGFPLTKPYPLHCLLVSCQTEVVFLCVHTHALRVCVRERETDEKNL